MITFCSHFYDVVLPFILTQTTQPLDENIINITLSICIVRIVPPRLQFFPFSQHSYLGWFLPFICNFLFGFHVSLAWLESYRPCFFCLSSKEIAGASWSQLWKEKKGVTPSSNDWKEITYDHRIRIKIF